MYTDARLRPDTVFSLFPERKPIVRKVTVAPPNSGVFSRLFARVAFAAFILVLAFLVGQIAYAAVSVLFKFSPSELAYMISGRG